MAYEPIRVPYPDPFEPNAWYCIHCGHARIDEASVRDHWRTQHKDDPDDVAVIGMDYARGTQLLSMQRRRCEWEEDRALEFAFELGKLYGAEDLVAEAEIGDSRA